MEIKDYLSLNEEQELLLDLQKDYVIQAGAGSGKTRVLVSRYLEILKSGQADVGEIVAITFTDNATREMKQRIKVFIREYVDKYGERNNLTLDTSRKLADAPISTIHGFAAKTIGENPYECKLDGNFKILEGVEQITYLEQSLNGFLGNAIQSADEGDNHSLNRILELEDFHYNSVFEKLKQMLELCNRFHLPARNISEPVTKNDTECLLKKLNKLITSGPQNSDNRFVNEHLKRLKLEATGFDNFESIKKLSEFINNIKMILSNDSGSPKGILSLAGASAEEREFAGECENIADSLLNIIDGEVTYLYTNLLSQFYSYYKSRKRAAGLMEYEDLLTTLNDLFESNKQILKFYRDKYKYILIDEFQDTDELQYKIVQMLSAGTGPNTFIVGDFKQSIFGFRGANPQLLSDLISTSESHILSYNYRSDERLVSFYNSFFGGFLSDSYTDMRSSMGLICATPVKEIIYSPASGKDRLESEARSVAMKIKELAAEGYKYGDIAIILKSNKTMHYFESALAENRIEYQSPDSGGLFDSQEVRDIVTLFKFIVNPNDRISEACVLRSVFFGASDSQLYSYFTVNNCKEITDFMKFIGDIRAEITFRKPFESLKLILDKTGYWSSMLALNDGVRRYRNILNLLEIFSTMETRGNNLREIIEYLDLSCEYGNDYISKQDLEDSDTVKILSVHKAKGLEFPVIILADLNHGSGGNTYEVGYSVDKGIILRMPGSKSRIWTEAQDWENKRKDEEEKRLLYVAMTRAEQKLVLSVSHVAKRNKGSFYDLIDSVIPISGIDEESVSLNFMEKQIPVLVYGDYDASDIQKSYESNAIMENTEDIKDELSSGTLLIKVPPLTKDDIPEFNSGRYNIVAGSIMHRFLQIWDFEENTINKYSAFVMNENCSVSERLFELLNKLALNFLDSDFIRLIESADKIEREQAFYLEIEGQKERRVIDLLIFNGGNISIYDYKYSMDIKTEYIEQMQLYEKAVLKKYGNSNTGKFIVHIPEVRVSNIG